MLIHEFRILLNMDVHEFQIAELYVVLDSKNDRSRGTQSIEVLKNEPYDNTQGQLGDISPLSKCRIPRNKGQYTLKKYLLAEVPLYLAALFPKGSLTIVEEAWNAFPTCFTYITSTYFLKHKFFIACESAYLRGNCTEENALHLSQEDLKRRSVQVIRIENDLPTKQPSTPSHVHPSTTMENAIREQHLKVFHTSSRRAFCLTDQWYGLSLDDIREFEAKQGATA
ncbi:unnamed protein product [Aphanomyces euteiches]